MPNEGVDALPGSSIVVQKGPADCNNLGPVTAGFNQAACGTFCGKDMCLYIIDVLNSNGDTFSTLMQQISSMGSCAQTLETAQCWHFVFKMRSWRLKRN